MKCTKKKYVSFWITLLYVPIYIYIWCDCNNKIIHAYTLSCFFILVVKNIAKSYENKTSSHAPDFLGLHARAVFSFSAVVPKNGKQNVRDNRIILLWPRNVSRAGFPASIARDNKLISYTEPTIRLTLKRLRFAVFGWRYRITKYTRPENRLRRGLNTGRRRAIQ